MYRSLFFSPLPLCNPWRCLPPSCSLNFPLFFVVDGKFVSVDWWPTFSVRNCDLFIPFSPIASFRRFMMSGCPSLSLSVLVATCVPFCFLFFLPIIHVVSLKTLNQGPSIPRLFAVPVHAVLAASRRKRFAFIFPPSHNVYGCFPSSKFPSFLFAFSLQGADSSWI